MIVLHGDMEKCDREDDSGRETVFPAPNLFSQQAEGQ